MANLSHGGNRLPASAVVLHAAQCTGARLTEFNPLTVTAVLTALPPSHVMRHGRPALNLVSQHALDSSRRLLALALLVMDSGSNAAHGGCNVMISNQVEGLPHMLYCLDTDRISRDWRRCGT